MKGVTPWYFRRKDMFMRILLLCMAVFFCFLGCGNQKSESSDEIVLTAWLTYKGPENEKFEELAAKFSKEYEKKHNKKVKILSKQVPFDDLVTNIKMSCQSKRTPDIARVDVQKVLELAYHQAVVKLDTLKNFDAKNIEEKASQYMPGPFNVNVVEIKNKKGEFEKHLYGLPEQASCLALFWNKKMFRAVANELRAAGLDPERAPKTWDELVEYSKVLTRDQYYGFAMNNSLWWSMPFFGLHKAHFIQVTADGKKVCTLGDDLSCAAFQLKVDLYLKHKIEAGAWRSGAIGPDVGFLNEKYAMIFMGPWNVQKFQEKNLDFDVALIPSISKERAQSLGIDHVESATNVGGNSMVVFQESAYKEIAYDFINYMSSWETQIEWCKALKQIPVNRKAANILMGKEKHPGYENIQIDPIIKVFMEQIQYAVAPPPVPMYSYIESDVLNPEMELALKGVKTVKKAFEDAAKKINDNVLSLVNE